MFATVRASANKSTPLQRRNQAFAPTPSALGAHAERSFIPGRHALRHTDRHRIDVISQLPAAVIDSLHRSGNVSGTATADGITIVSGSSIFLCHATGCHQLEFTAETHGVLVARIPPAVQGGAYGVFAANRAGNVRYWADASRPASWQDVALPLAGRTHVTRLVYCSRNTVVAVASDTALFRVTWSSPALNARRIQRPASMLSKLGFGIGLGKVLGWDAAASGVALAATSGRETQAGREIFVLTDKSLQKWEITPARENLLREAQILDMLVGQFPEDNGERQLFLLDVAASRGDAVVLAASRESEEPGCAVVYWLVTLSDDGANLRLTSISNLMYQAQYDPSDPTQLDAQLILPRGGPAAYVKFPTMVICTAVPEDPRPLDSIVIGGAPGSPVTEQIIASGASDDGALLVSAQLGVVVVTQTDFAAAARDVPPTPVPAEKGARAAREPRGPLSDVLRLFAEGSPAVATEFRRLEREKGSDWLHTAFVDESRRIVDARPQFDPHWADEGAEDAAPTSVRLQGQLEGKQRRHEELLRCAMQLFSEGGREALQTMLSHGEKVAAARALRTRQNETQKSGLPDDWKEFNAVLVAAMKSVIAERPREDDLMGTQDAFYSTVSKVDEVLAALAASERSILADTAARHSASGGLPTVSAVNAIFVAMIGASQQFLAQHTPDGTFLSWAADDGVRGGLEDQIALTMELLQNIESVAPNPAPLLAQLYDLADVLLNGYVMEMDSHRVENDALFLLRERFDQARNVVIAPFMELREYERAQDLAERYRAFPTLVELCELHDNTALLEDYMRRFEEFDFAAFTFQWYLSKGLRHKLLTLGERHKPELTRFLTDYPHLRWLHEIHTGSFMASAGTLLDESRREVHSLGRRKTLASLQRLAVVAAVRPEELDGHLGESERELHLVMAHSKLPGLTKVLTPEQLVRALIGNDEYATDEGKSRQSPEPLHFSVALEVLEYAAADQTAGESAKQRQVVWEKILLTEDWVALEKRMGECASDAEVENAYSQTILCQVMESASIWGCATREMVTDIFETNGSFGDGRIRSRILATLQAAQPNGPSDTMVEG